MRLSKRNAPERRASFPERHAMEVAPNTGKTTTTQTPLSIRTQGLTLDDETRDYLRQRLGFKLGKFAPRIRSIIVKVVDVSGPTGAPLIACRIDVYLDVAQDTFIEQRHATLRGALDLAADRVERAVRRQLDRERKQRT